jgi:hypothetical protein
MTNYLISFPSAVMTVPENALEEVGQAARAVVAAAKAAGVYVYAGGINESAPPVLVAADGTISAGGYPWAPSLDGGFTVLELPSRADDCARTAMRRLGFAALHCASACSFTTPPSTCSLGGKSTNLSLLHSG